ncbi:hypothetical protein H0H81_009107, partial [Sphagnurus paluster]
MAGLVKDESNTGINEVDAPAFRSMIALLVLDSAKEFQHNREEMRKMRQELQKTREVYSEVLERLAIAEQANSVARQLILAQGTEAANFRERERTLTHHMLIQHRRIQRLEGVLVDPPLQRDPELAVAELEDPPPIPPMEFVQETQTELPGPLPVLVPELAHSKDTEDHEALP